MKCSVLNEANKNESILFPKLLKILGNHGLAEQAYSDLINDEFLEDFGDWIGAYNSGYQIGPQIAERVDENGEPTIHRKEGTNQYFFEGINGRVFLNKVKFAEIEETDVQEIVDQLVYDFITSSGKRSLNEIESGDLKPGDLMPSIQKSIADYKEAVAGDEELIERADLVLKYADEFEAEIFNKLESLGQSVRRKVSTFGEQADLTDSFGNELDEVPEDKKDTNQNFTESFENNSKDSATMNTKLFLSGIVATEINDQGEYVAATGDFLRKQKFTPFEDVWSTLEPMLADVVGHGHGHDVHDVFDLMILEIDKLKFIKPWSIDLLNKLEVLRYSNEDKVTEFVQAFSKTRINFYVTEVNGNRYKVINATSTNSRESKIMNQWGVNFSDNFVFVGGKLTDVSIKKINEISIELKEAFDQYNSELSKTKGDKIDVNTEAIYQFAEVASKLGIDIGYEDVDSFILLHGGDEKTFREVSRLFKSALFVTDHLLDPKTRLTVEGEFQNPFLTESKGIRDLARAIGMRMTDVAENTVIMNEGKMGWTYASPSYLSNKINEWKADRSSLEDLAELSINRNSRWIKYLLGTEIDRNREDALRVSESRLDKLKLGLSSSFKSSGKNDGVDNKEITFPDAINDNIVKLLGGKRSGGKSYFPTMVPADKSRRIEIEGMEFTDSRIDTINDAIYIHPDTVSIFLGYFEDEYSRMKHVATEIEKRHPDSLVVHYHTGAKNGLKSQVFPEFSHENKNMDPELRALLYDSKGLPHGRNVAGLDPTQKAKLREMIEQDLIDRVNETKEELAGLDNLSSELLASYSSKRDAATAMAGDYLVNGLIASVEYTKMFSGDPAYYKNMADMIKRIPATYTDGLQLRLQTDDHLWFKQATVQGVEVASQYIDLIKKSVKDKSIIKAYENVNTTDAQAWITPNRWRFLKKRLGQWSPLHDKAFDNMMAGKALSEKELKVAAQPLKGVYFEINNGRPVYLKYSQAVLIPDMVAKTPMNAIYESMVIKNGEFVDAKDEVHEVVTIDGVKVGAVAPTRVNEDGSIQVKESFELNPVTLSNRGWKLQQDLPSKNLKATKVGSQIQKNILSGIALKSKKYTLDGEKKTGQEILDEIHSTVSALSNMGRARIEKEFGISEEDSRITDKDRLYKALIEEFKSRGGNDNVISALEKELPFDAIPQVRGKIQSIFMAIMNKEMVKIETNGGSLIQVSPFGLETVTDVAKSGIKIVSSSYDGKGLKPPRKEGGVIKPGQVFVPYSKLRGLLKGNNVDYDNMTGEELMEHIDPSALQMVTYRIPNQGMSSNDAVEIVGILPDGMGDSIISYDAVPAKTGSDFDIDKMFIMMHNLEFTDGKVRKVPSDGKGKKSTQNKLVDLYYSILTSPDTYDAMMTSIDGSFLKDDIVDLFPAEELSNLEFNSPIKQMRTKFEYLTGKFGVAQTANQLVDHSINQTQDVRLIEGLGGIGHMVGSNTKFDNMMDTDGKHNIGDTLSSFLNAYVDIAKDPYISRGNHNSVTSGVTFMLIRAGVPIEWVNRFIAQPAIVELVKLTNNSEGITSKRLEIGGRKATAYEKVREMLGSKKIKMNETKVSKLSKRQMEFSISKPIIEMTQDELNFQANVLDVFESYVGSAKLFNKSVISSKADTNGGGGSFMDRVVLENKWDEVANSDKLVGFRGKFDKTALGTYHSNSIDWVGEVITKSELLLTVSDGFIETVNDISNRLGKGIAITDIELAKTVESAFYTYAMSGTNLFFENHNDTNELFIELPKKIQKLKKEVDNFLLDELQIKKSGGFNYLSVDSKNKPSIYHNRMHRAWMNLYLDPTYKDVAIELARYSFSQSGFKNNLNQFFTYLPHEILMDHGIAWNINLLKDEMDDIQVDNNFREQLYRNGWENDKLVPNVTLKNAIRINNKRASLAFVYSDVSEGSSISTGVTENGENTYPEFVKGVINSEAVSREGAVPVKGLFKMRGLVQIDNPNTEAAKKTPLVYAPVYSRTYKLGTKSNHGSIVEYSYDEKISGSKISSNDFSNSEKVEINEMIKFAKESLGLVDDLDFSNPFVEVEDNVEVAGEKIINQEDLGAFQRYLDKSKGKLPDIFFTPNTRLPEFYNNVRGVNDLIPQNYEWKLNSGKKYDLVNVDDGEVVVTNVDLKDGVQYNFVSLTVGDSNPIKEAGISYGVDILMGEEATQYIGSEYIDAWGANANTGQYTNKDVVMVSGYAAAEGMNDLEIAGEYQTEIAPIMDKAIKANASFVMARSNIFEELAKAQLDEFDYSEIENDGYFNYVKENC